MHNRQREEVIKQLLIKRKKEDSMLWVNPTLTIKGIINVKHSGIPIRI